MRQAPRFAKKIADEHLQAFSLQMREKLGVDRIVLQEPYLPFALARSELLYLRRMERLRQRLLSVKALQITIPDPANLPVDGQGDYDADGNNNHDSNADIDDAANRAAIEAKQALDADRQKASGIRKFIWQTHGGACPLCAPYDGGIFTWGEGEEPGEIHPNCQCSAEPVLDGADIDDPPIEPVYPIEDLIGLLAGAGLARRLGMAAIRRAQDENVQRTISEEEALPKPDVFERPEGVPEDWEGSLPNKGEGVRYRDPENMHNEVRVQKGNPENSNPYQKEDYVRWKKNGQWLDKNGNPSTDYKQTHIPINEFEFKPEIFQ